MASLRLQAQLANPRDEDRAETTRGVSTGRGILGRMLDWLKPAGNGSANVAPIEAFDSGDSFDPVAFQDYLRKFQRQYGHLMEGRGLILGAGQAAPPTAFQFLKGASEGLAVVGGLSLDLDDYADRAVPYELRQNHGIRIDAIAPAQFAWIANVALVRTAVRMAPYACSKPTLSWGSGGRFPALQFDAALDQEARIAPLASADNPLAMRAGIEASLGAWWQHAVRMELKRLEEELAVAMVEIGWAKGEAERIVDLMQDVLVHGPIVRSARRLHLHLANLTHISELVRTTVSGFDRTAIRHVARHGTGRLCWQNLYTHLDPELQLDIERHRSLGSLAVAKYLPATLVKLQEGHREGSMPIPYTGEFSAAFASAFDQQLGARARSELNERSPRYLGAMIYGHHRLRSLEATLLDEGGDTSPAAAARCGMRLGLAFERLVFESTAKTAAPWSTALCSPNLYDILKADISDEQSVEAATRFLKLVNAWRAQGELRWKVDSAPQCADILLAPAANPVDALVAMHGPRETPAAASSKRMAATLARDLLGSTIETASPNGDGSKVTWRLAYVQVGDDQAFAPESELSLVFATPDGRHVGVDVNFEPAVDRWLKGTSDVWKSFETDFGLSILTRLDASIPLTRLKEARLSPSAAPRSKVRVLRHTPVGKPTLKQPSVHGAPTIGSDASAAIEQLLTAVGHRLSGSVNKAPLHVAALVPKVAAFLAQVEHRDAMRIASGVQTLRLAKVCLHQFNAVALELMLAGTARPAVRSEAGHSVLDIALESIDSALGEAAMRGLSRNAEMQKDGRLAALLDASIGKLVERHPGLLPLATSLGARLSEEATASWNALHPNRKSPEAAAAVLEGQMRDCIDQIVNKEPLLSEAAPPKRRRACI